MDSASKPSYSRDLWDQHGIKMITERIKKTEKANKSLQQFFIDIANNAFVNSKVYHKLPSNNISTPEFGTLKFIMDRYTELVETMSKNEEILGSKLKTQCYQKLHDDMDNISKINYKLLNDLKSYNNTLEKEEKKLKKSKKEYDVAKRNALNVSRSLKMEKEHLTNCKGNPNLANNTQQIEKNILSLQQTLKQKKQISRDALESYIKAVSIFRGFRQRFDVTSSQILDQLELNDRKRADLIHGVICLHLEVQKIMAEQSLKNIQTIAQHVHKIDAASDNMLFVEKYRSNIQKPELPKPKFHPDDDDTIEKTNINNIENSAEVKFWCEKWKLVIDKLLNRDISPKNNNNNDDNNKKDDDNSIENDENKNNDDNNNVNDDDYNPANSEFNYVNLTDVEFNTLKSRCLESLDSKHGRLAFALIINRQRNNEFGLELGRDSFLALVELCNLFYKKVSQSNPIDIKPAKLVMIMSQSLYVRKSYVLDLLTEAELKEFEATKSPKKKKVQQNFDENGNNIKKKRNSFLPKKDKLFLADRLKKNMIWKQEKFWKEAYCDSVQQELRKYPKIKRWHSEKERNDGDRRSEQIVFSQLAAWTHNMKEFGMDNKTIEKFLESQDLQKDKVIMLKTTLNLYDDNNNDNNKNDNTINDDDNSVSSPKSQGLP